MSMFAGEGTPEKSGSDYDRHKDRQRKTQAEKSKAGRSIGEIPPVKDAKRRKRAGKSFKLFCEYYFPETFTLLWSKDHLRAIQKIERAVLKGGLFAFAMPRGSGKTTLCECAVMWAVLFGFRRFVALIGASATHAEEMLDSIKIEIETNDYLAEDFPEVTFPIRAIEGIANRCKGQLYNGERTRITWTDGRIVLPTIPGSIASGAIIRAAGIEGRIRGMKQKRQDGTPVRPDLAVCDDPQTDESAASAVQNASREKTLAGAVLGLAGPGKKISGLMPCTVIQPDDMADRILNPQKHPEWQGERMRLVDAWPTSDLWNKYAELWSAGHLRGIGNSDALKFYRKNRKAMDAGGKVAWPARKREGDVSAIQHAWDLRLEHGEASFAAEFQNDPINESNGPGKLVADDIVQRLNRIERGTVPAEFECLTAFIDVQKEALFWLVAAWGRGFSGAIVDYGAYPDQRRAYFRLADVQPTLMQAFSGRGFEGALYAGLENLTTWLAARQWPRAGGGVVHLAKLIIDANWPESTDVVYKLCQQSKHASLLLPWHGRGISAKGRPMAEWTVHPGSTKGRNWMINRGNRPIRHVVPDTNFWKSFAKQRLLAAIGDPGSLTLFGDNPAIHRMFADHCTAEFATETSGHDRRLEEWTLRPGRPDNHWWDCLTGSAVAASIEGISLPEWGEITAPRREAKLPKGRRR